MITVIMIPQGILLTSNFNKTMKINGDLNAIAIVLARNLTIVLGTILLPY